MAVAAETLQVLLHGDVSLSWRPGQFITVQIPNSEGRPLGRSYSIASRLDAVGSAEIVLLIKLVAAGVGSVYMAGLMAGDVVSFTGPWGKFIVAPTAPEVPAVFVGTGTGVAPFVPMIDEVLAQGRRVTLLAGFRHEQEYAEAMIPLAQWQATGRFDMHVMISQPSETWNGTRGRVTDYLRAHPEALVGAQLYICGNGSMVQEVREFAAEQGMTADQIFFEKYNAL